MKCILLAASLIAVVSCKGESLPKDTMPGVAAGLVPVSVVLNPRSDKDRLKITFQAPAGTKEIKAHVVSVPNGYTITIGMFELKTDAPTIAQGMKIRKELVKRSTAPAGYAVAAPWWGTEEIFPKMSQGSAIAYTLFDGKGLLAITCGWHPADGGTEAGARQLAANVVRTIKAE